MVKYSKKEVISMYDFRAIIEPPHNPANRAADEAGKVAENTNKIYVEMKDLRSDLKDESENRTKSDKFYFWLGVICSAIIAFSVQYLPMLIRFLQSLHQQ